MWSSPLVVGGNGFIGARLVDYLSLRGDVEQIVVVDPAPLRPNPRPRRGNAPVKTIRGANPHIQSPEPSVVVCLAGVVGPAGVLHGDVLRGTTSPVEYCVRVARAHDAPLIVFSSSEVYGAGDYAGGPAVILPERATYRSHYAIAKLYLEAMVAEHHMETHLPALTLRPFNTAGYGQDWRKGFVVPRFVRQAAQGEDITVYGDHLRSFTLVDDMVTWIIERAPSYDDIWQGVPLDLGDADNRIRIPGLAQAVLDEVGATDSRIRHVRGTSEHGQGFSEAPNLDKTPSSNAPSYRRGWEPEGTLAMIVREAIRYHEDTDGA